MPWSRGQDACGERRVPRRSRERVAVRGRREDVPLLQQPLEAPVQRPSQRVRRSVRSWSTTKRTMSRGGSRRGVGFAAAIHALRNGDEQGSGRPSASVRGVIGPLGTLEDRRPVGTKPGKACRPPPTVVGILESYRMDSDTTSMPRKITHSAVRLFRDEREQQTRRSSPFSWETLCALRPLQEPSTGDRQGCNSFAASFS